MFRDCQQKNLPLWKGIQSQSLVHKGRDPITENQADCHKDWRNSTKASLSSDVWHWSPGLWGERSGTDRPSIKLSSSCSVHPNFVLERFFWMENYLGRVIQMHVMEKLSYYVIQRLKCIVLLYVLHNNCTYKSHFGFSVNTFNLDMIIFFSGYYLQNTITLSFNKFEIFNKTRQPFLIQQKFFDDYFTVKCLVQFIHIDQNILIRPRHSHVCK